MNVNDTVKWNDLKTGTESVPGTHLKSHESVLF